MMGFSDPIQCSSAQGDSAAGHSRRLHGHIARPSAHTTARPSVALSSMENGLARFCAANRCALLFAVGSDAPDGEAAAAAIALIGVKPGHDTECVALVTPDRVLLCSSESHWAAMKNSRMPASTHNTVFVAPASDTTATWRAQAVGRMLEYAAAIDLPVVAGLSTKCLDVALSAWPLLRGVGPGRLPPPMPQVEAAASALLALLDRGAASNRLARGASLLERSWEGLLRAIDSAARREGSLSSLTEAQLERTAADAADSTATTVRLGIRTRDESGKRYAVHSAGKDRAHALHLTARATDAQTGLSVARTLFLSNGAAPHHWQHRVFPDGEVLPPLVEDEVGEVECAARTARLMRLYCTLVAVAREVAERAAGGTLGPEEADSILRARLAGEDASQWLGEQPYDAGASVWRGLVGDGEQGAADSQAAPAEWLLHSVRVQLDIDEGRLLFEQPFVLDGDGWREVVRLPPLSCWMLDGVETSEARTIRAAVTTNAPCPLPSCALSRLHAGEHAQLQTLLCEPIECTLLLDSSWLPAVRGEARLFAGGIAFDSERHGPLLLPFRIHLAAVTAFNLGGSEGTGALCFRQAEAWHAYGPLALLPDHSGLRVLTLALAVPCRSTLHRALEETAWPHWARLFAECDIPVRAARQCPAFVEEALRRVD